MEATNPICDFACRICGNSKKNKIYKVREMMYGTREVFDYAECAECKCLQLINIPVDMSKYYPSDYYSFKKNPEATSPKVRNLTSYLLRKRNLYHITKRSLVGWLVCTLSPSNNPYSLIAKTRIKKSASILDIGCGNGELLYDLRNIGCRHTLGADPYIKDDITYRNGLKIMKKSIFEIEGKYDLIMLHHSFEHMNEPLKVLHAVHRLLKPKGNCLIRIPTVSSYAWKHYRENWCQIDAPRHFFLHSIKSMEILSSKAGFCVENVIYDSMSFQFWSSEQYIRDIPFLAEKSAYIDPEKSIFTMDELRAFTAKANELNKQNLGDMAAFFLKKVYYSDKEAKAMK